MALFIVLIIALSFYLSDERLKSMIVPQLNEMAGREIQVDRISYSLFRSFPSFSLVIEGFSVPDTDPQAGDDEVLASVDELLLAVNLVPLLSGNVNVSRLDVDRPVFNYVMYEDGRTNLDSLLEFMDEDAEPAAEEQAELQIDLQAIALRNGNIGYYDRSSRTTMLLRGLDADISLSYGQNLTSTIDASVDGLSVEVEGEAFLRNLPLSISQRSVIDLEQERANIEEGRLNIRGLDMDMSGEIADYGSEAPFIDLQINSSSDNFGALLELVPEAYKAEFEGVETRGALVLGAQISGRFGEDQIPDFEVVAGVEEGFLRYPDVASAIEDITLDMRANNNEVVIQSFTARAAGNAFSAEGLLNQPLEEDADFDFSMDLDLDLATIAEFYPLEDLELQGQLSVNASTQGRIDDAENARFSAIARLDDGFVQYAEVDEPIRNMNVAINANQSRIIIQSFAAEAAENRLTLSGTVREPLNEDQTSFQLVADASLDLASVPKFYPIDTDTLDMRGEFRFDGSASGRLADIENASISGRFSLEDGFLAYHELPKPIDELMFRGRISQRNLSLDASRLRTGNNNFTARGSVADYLTDNPVSDLLVEGQFDLSELHEFADLEPYINELSGHAESNIRVRGPVMEPERLRFNGMFELREFAVQSDSLPEPITRLDAVMDFSDAHVGIESFSMEMGSSDVSFEGELRNYMRLVEENGSELATLNARFHSGMLHVDEFYEYVPPPEDAEPEPFPVELPRLEMNMDVDIGELIFLGISMTDISGEVSSTDTRFAVEDAVADVFEGDISGRLVWDVPDPEQTKITFEGNMNGLEIQDLLRQVNPAGLEDMDDYFSGRVSGDILYITEMDVFLEPVIPTTVSEGSFTMAQARMKDHPAQIRVADALRSQELRDLSLDDVDAIFNIESSVMTLERFNLTSQDIGLELEGTQHLETEEMDYTASVILPGRLSNNLEPVITSAGVSALTREDGKMPIPIRIRGTMEDPNVSLNTSEIQERIRDSASDSVRDRVRDLFGN